MGVTRITAPTAWTRRMPVAPAGDGLRTLYGMYDVRPETEITGTLTLPTEQNGPMKVFAFGDVTLDGAAIVPAYACRTLILLFKSLTVAGAASTISMAGKGAIESASWPVYDLSFPQSVDLASEAMTYREIQRQIRANGFFPGDPVLWREWRSLVAADITPGTAIITAAGCGAAGSRPHARDNDIGSYPGGTGAKGPGGGASGSATHGYMTDSWGGLGEKGFPWRGGFGGQSAGAGAAGLSAQALKATTSDPTLLLGHPGGVLIVGVLGDVVVGPGLTITASADATGLVGGYGGPGGGRAALYYGGALTGTPTLAAAGVSNGGAGYCDVATFAAMGL
ncbi:MAG: hypothetical protein AB7D37_19180 [Desulfovibrio sp.]